MTGSLDRLRAKAADRAAAGLRRTLTPRPPGDDLLDLASNDYLGLARDPRVIAGAVAAAHRWGAGSTGSRLVTGTTELHGELEYRLAEITGAARGLVFSSGYLANLAAVTALSGPGTLVVSDRRNHASLVDACRLARSRVVVTAHRDVAAVEAALIQRDEPNAIVVTDAVFSVDGDLAPLGELHAATGRHAALLVVDEAHALGVIGDRGQGAVHAAGLAGRPDVVLTATLSKSLGSQGGVVLGAPEIIETLVDTGRSFIFDTGLAPPCAGAALAALDILTEDPRLAGRARERARRIAGAAAAAGLSPAVPDAAVVSVVLGPPEAAVRAARTCAEHGVRVGCFRPPSVPAGRACLRLTGRASLSADDLVMTEKALTAAAQERPEGERPPEDERPPDQRPEDAAPGERRARGIEWGHHAG